MIEQDLAALSLEFPTFVFSTSVLNLGSSVSRSYPLLSAITTLTRSCFDHLRQLQVVFRSLSSSSTATLVHAFIVNRVDHCSSLYCGLPEVRLQPLNGVLRAAARMIGDIPRFGHISEFIRDTLRWLPVLQRIHYRLSSIVWRCVLGIAPAYLLDLFILTSSCTGRKSLRSASRGDFLVPQARTAIKQHRAFSSVHGVPLLGTVSHLNSALFHGMCPARSISSLTLLFSLGPGLAVAAPLSSYLEVALYKCHIFRKRAW